MDRGTAIMIVTVLAFLVALAILIAVHEWGHYRMAVAFDVKVLRFSLGFGRVVLRRPFGPDRTEFVVSALPLGGYVRMLDEREAPVAPQELGRAFNRKPLGQRALIVAAGPAANLVLAVLLYALVQFTGVDVPKALLGAPPPSSQAALAGLKAGDWVRSWSLDGQTWEDVRSIQDLRWQVTDAVLAGRPLVLSVSDREGRGSRVVRLDFDAGLAREFDAGALARLGFGAAYSEPVIGRVVEGGAAQDAGLRQGDRVLAVDGRPVPDAAWLRQWVREGAGQAQDWHVDRGGQALTLRVTPRSVTSGDGRVLGRIEAIVGAPVEMVNVRSGPLASLGEGLQRTWEVSALTVRMIGRMLVGEASVRNLSGPLTIADFAGQSARRGWTDFLVFLALVSVSLGVLNLLPLPMLDGGHLMYYFFEAVTGRPVPERWLERLQRGGIAVLLMLMSVALFNDIARLVGLH